tara:strand:+ start:65 stop:256 length:192 start_codon:yes stop_codon:yes gene_type:complete
MPVCPSTVRAAQSFDLHRNSGHDASRSVNLGVIKTTINNMPITPLGADYASERFERLLAGRYG